MEDRFIRQKQIISFGEKGQEALQKAKVLIVGCGGLGCPVAMYLSRAGVVHIGLVDGDVVQLSNLHRQILFNEQDVGSLKVEAAQQALLLGNSDLLIQTYPYRLNTKNYKEILSEYDVIIDCSDNFETRYLVNDACVILKKPLVYGAANQLEGQVAVFNYMGSGNLRDVFPELPKDGTIQNCEEAGVLGVITGIIGDLMAWEVIKLITGVGKPLINTLMQFDGETSRLFSFNYTPNQSMTKPIVHSDLLQITWQEYSAGADTFQLVDVRTKEEREVGHKGGIHIPLSELQVRLTELEKYSNVAFYCQTGKRAIQAAGMCQNDFETTTITAIVGDL